MSFIRTYSMVARKCKPSQFIHDPCKKNHCTKFTSTGFLRAFYRTHHCAQEKIFLPDEALGTLESIKTHLKRAWRDPWWPISIQCSARRQQRLRYGPTSRPHGSLLVEQPTSASHSGVLGGVFAVRQNLNSPRPIPRGFALRSQRSMIPRPITQPIGGHRRMHTTSNQSPSPPSSTHPTTPPSNVATYSNDTASTEQSPQVYSAKAERPSQSTPKDLKHTNRNTFLRTVKEAAEQRRQNVTGSATTPLDQSPFPPINKPQPSRHPPRVAHQPSVSGGRATGPTNSKAPCNTSAGSQNNMGDEFSTQLKTSSQSHPLENTQQFMKQPRQQKERPSVAPNPSHYRDSSNATRSQPWRAPTYRPSEESQQDSMNNRLNNKFTKFFPRANSQTRMAQGTYRPNDSIHRRIGETIQRIESSADVLGQPINIARSVEDDIGIQRLRGRTISRIDSVIKRNYGIRYRVELFGSTLYGVSSAKSDLDLVIVDLDRMDGFPPSVRIDRLPLIYNVRQLGKKIWLSGYKEVKTIAAANVPIVKFKDPQTGIDCDINVNDQLGLINSTMLKNYCDISTILRPMLLLIKAWAKPLGLNHPSGGGPATFSSYALALMTIGFLQMRGLLPNLQANLPPLNSQNDAGGTFWIRHKNGRVKCDTRYNLYRGQFPAEGDVETLMKDWFGYWADGFKYEETMISIREGGVVQRPTPGPSMSNKKGKGKEKEKEAIGEECEEVDPEPENDELEAIPIAEDATVEVEVGEATTTQLQEPAAEPEVDENSVRPDEWKKYFFVVADPFIRRKNCVQAVSLKSLRRFREECRRAVSLIRGGKSVEKMIKEIEPVDFKVRDRRKKGKKEGKEKEKAVPADETRGSKTPSNNTRAHLVP